MLLPGVQSRSFHSVSEHERASEQDMMYEGPIGRDPVMALSWNCFAVDYCRDCIMAVAEIDHEVMSLRVHVLALEDEAFDGDTSHQHNWELAIVPHYWFLHYYNMDPRWNCLGYLNISVGMSVAAMIVVSKFWINQATTSVPFLFSTFLSSSSSARSPQREFVSYECVQMIVAIYFLFFYSHKLPSCRWELLLFRLVCFSSVPLIVCWCCALIQLDHVPLCIEIWLISFRSSSFVFLRLILLRSMKPFCFYSGLKKYLNNQLHSPDVRLQNIQVFSLLLNVLL